MRPSPLSSKAQGTSKLSNLTNNERKHVQDADRNILSEQVVNILSESLVGTRSDALLFCGGVSVLCLLVTITFYAPAACTLLYLLFAATCLPHRVASFARRKWTFFLVDFCYFANLACCTFLVFTPQDAALEAAVYVLCEGPLAAALIAWQCAWVLGSPDHAISVMVHLLPGLALFCHRFLSYTRRPLLLASQMGLALMGKDPWVVGPAAAGETTCASHGRGRGPGCTNEGASSAAPTDTAATVVARAGTLLMAAVDVMRGRLPCTAAAIGPATAAAATPLPSSSAAWKPSVASGGAKAGVCVAEMIGRGMDAGSSSGWSIPGLAPRGVGLDGAAVASYLQPAPAPSPSPSWLWLGVAPMAFYLVWQLIYFLIVQVACRRRILAGGYDTSYRALARRAQRANNIFNRLVRCGSVTRRLLVYGLLQLLFTVATQAWAIVTYQSFAAAVVWQVTKFVVPLYLGACHQCQRQPAQQLRVAAAKLMESGCIAPGRLGGERLSALPVAAAPAAVAIAATATTTSLGASRGQSRAEVGSGKELPAVGPQGGPAPAAEALDGGAAIDGKR